MKSYVVAKMRTGKTPSTLMSIFIKFRRKRVYLNKPLIMRLKRRGSPELILHAAYDHFTKLIRPVLIKTSWHQVKKYLGWKAGFKEQQV